MIRRGDLIAILAMLVLASCTTSTQPFRDMVGYVPPTSLPAQPRRTVVEGDLVHVWNHLLGFLYQSDFEIDHQDSSKRLIVARYSGNPEPFIDCGSIVTEESGALGEVPGAIRQVSLNHDLDGQPVILDRSLNLDGRIIIRLQERSFGTVITTDTTYVVTKTVSIAASSGATVEGSRETVNFSAGKRAEFGKGTACQPTGSLDFAVLQGLPNVVGSKEIARADLAVDTPDDIQLDDQVIVQRAKNDRDDLISDLDQSRAEISDSGLRLEDGGDRLTAPAQPEKDWIYVEPNLTDAETLNTDRTDEPLADQQFVNLEVEDKPTGVSEPLKAGASEARAYLPNRPVSPDLEVDDTPSIVDETTKTLLRTLDCQGKEWHFCEAVKLTSPYRKLNIEKGMGLTVNTVRSVISQSVGSDLELDVDLPTFPSYLQVIYVERSGFIERVVTSSAPWPADSSRSLKNIDHAIPGPSGLALIVAIVSEQPLFPSGMVERQEAGTFLKTLEQRFAEIDAEPNKNRIAASQLLINVE